VALQEFFDCPRARRKSEVELFTATLATLEDHFDLAAHLEAKDALDRIVVEAVANTARVRRRT